MNIYSGVVAYTLFASSAVHCAANGTVVGYAVVMWLGASTWAYIYRVWKKVCQRILPFSFSRTLGSGAGSGMVLTRLGITHGIQPSQTRSL